MSTLTRVATRCEASCGEQVSSVCGWPAAGRRGDNQGVKEAGRKRRAICEMLEVRQPCLWLWEVTVPGKLMIQSGGFISREVV